VAQGVGTPVEGRAAHRGQAAAGDVVEAPGGERPEGGLEREEHLAPGTAWADALQVVQDRLPHGARQRVGLGAALLGPRHPDHLVFPVEVLQAQPGNLAHAQAVDGEEQQEGPIPDVARPVGLGTREEALHLLPRGTRRAGLLSEEARGLNRGGDPARALARHLGVSEERPQRFGARGNGDPGPASATEVREERVDMGDAHGRQGAALGHGPAQELANVPATVADRDRGEAARALHPDGELLAHGAPREWLGQGLAQAAEKAEPVGGDLDEQGPGPSEAARATAAPLPPGPRIGRGGNRLRRHHLTGSEMERTGHHEKLAGKPKQGLAGTPLRRAMGEVAGALCGPGSVSVMTENSRVGEQLVEHDRTSFLWEVRSSNPGHLCGVN